MRLYEYNEEEPFDPGLFYRALKEMGEVEMAPKENLGTRVILKAHQLLEAKAMKAQNLPKTVIADRIGTTTSILNNYWKDL